MTGEVAIYLMKDLNLTFRSRLFRPSISDDPTHDEALSSRIAALNMLNLGLEHLGVDAGVVAPDVERVISACGQSGLSESHD